LEAWKTDIIPKRTGSAVNIIIFTCENVRESNARNTMVRKKTRRGKATIVLRGKVGRRGEADKVRTGK